MNPATNIALSGGTHTVRCDATGTNLSITPYKGDPSRYGRGIVGDNLHGISTNGSGITQGVNDLQLVTHRFSGGTHISKLTFSVRTAGLLGELAKVGIWNHLDERNTGSVIWESAVIAVDSTGFKSVTCDVDLPAGLYDIGVVTNSATMKPRTLNSAFGSNLYYIENANYSEFCKSSPIGSLWTSAPIGSNPASGVNPIGTYSLPFIFFNANAI